MTVETALHLAITVPFVAALVAWIIPRRISVVTKVMAVIVSAGVMVGAVVLHRSVGYEGSPEWLAKLAPKLTESGPLLGLDGLSGLVMLGAGFFALVIAVYSVGFLRDETVSPRSYYANFLLVIGATCATIVSRNLLVLLFFWALMGIPFFLLVNLGGKGASAAAKKTLIILGGSDCVMILGIALIYQVSGSFDLLQPKLVLAGVSVFACLCLAAAAFAKAGAIPLHSWVPDAAQTAPVPAVALLPASLDKLLGIYLFARVSLNLFEIGGMMQDLFILIGAVTVMAAVMAALVQHNLRRLLGFHAVSQVGYMVLGIATGTPIGVLGGLFHMVNHALYKSCLFLTAGAAERRSGTGELDGMGGMARAMPVTFAAAVVAALAISGVPPINGFISKWMVYQGLIEMKGTGSFLWPVALVAAMFGSALTLASFVKVLHAVFLGRPRAGVTHDGPTPNIFMGVPIAILALVCVVFGVFAYAIPVKLLVSVLPDGLPRQLIDPVWKPDLATALLGVGLLAGALIYLLGKGIKVREDESYIGGEAGARAADYRYSGVEFYRTVAQVPSLRALYDDAEKGWYDLYYLGQRLAAWVALPLQRLHSGLLLSYVGWCVLGLVVLLWVFLN